MGTGDRLRDLEHGFFSGDIFDACAARAKARFVAHFLRQCLDDRWINLHRETPAGAIGGARVGQGATVAGAARRAAVWIDS